MPGTSSIHHTLCHPSSIHYVIHPHTALCCCFQRNAWCLIRCSVAKNASTTTNPPLASIILDRALLWILVPGCFIIDIMDHWYWSPTYWASLYTVARASVPIHDIALCEHHMIALPLWPSSHGIWIFQLILISDADAMRHFCAVVGRPSVGPSM